MGPAGGRHAAAFAGLRIEFGGNLRPEQREEVSGEPPHLGIVGEIEQVAKDTDRAFPVR